MKKLVDGKCLICGLDAYEVLDCHRLVAGRDGGRYDDYNTVTLCVLCHRKAHDGVIRILGKHFSTAGRYVLHYLDEAGAEVWK